MRLKHIKNAEETIYKSNFVIKKPFEYKSKWKDIFKNDNDIYLEIGMGKGDFLISLAVDNPNKNFIGIEKYASVILSAIKKIESLNIENIKIICIDAFNITEIFDKEIKHLYLNFSDPWPKKRHIKRRLTSDMFLNKYDNIFTNKRIIEMKTDNDLLFEFSLESFEKNGYNIKEINRNINSKYKTEYEKKFIEKGKNINYCKVEK